MAPGDRTLLKYAVFVSGRGSNLLALLEACEKGIVPSRPSLVLTDNTEAGALSHAAKYGIETVFINPKIHKGKTAYGEEVIRILKERGVEAICLAGFMRIIGENVVNAFPGRILNIHPSLLPSFPGLDAQKQALDAGAAESGCTVHVVDAGVDTGPIVSQARVKVEKSDTVETLSAKILKEEHRIYPVAVAALVEGRLQIHDGKAVIKGR